VISEDDFRLERIQKTRVLVLESRSVLNEAERKIVTDYERAGGRIVSGEGKDWLKKLRDSIGEASIEVESPSPNVRVCVHDQPGRTIVHVVNLNLRRLSSFRDEVKPVEGIDLRVRVPFETVRSVQALTPDDGTDHGVLKFKAAGKKDAVYVEMRLSRLEISTILVIEE
jgi:hypothetical protein